MSYDYGTTYEERAQIAEAELARLRADNRRLAQEGSALSVACDAAAAALRDFAHSEDWPSDETVDAVLATVEQAQKSRGTNDMFDEVAMERAEGDRLRAELDAMTRRAELAEGYAQPYHDESARLRAELERARRLIAAAVFNDLSDMAADGVTVGMLWQKDALAFLSALSQEPPA